MPERRSRTIAGRAPPNVAERHRVSRFGRLGPEACIPWLMEPIDKENLHHVES
jgi:hypothetical protein